MYAADRGAGVDLEFARAMKEAANCGGLLPVPRSSFDFCHIARAHCAGLNCAHAGRCNCYSCLFGVGNRAAAPAPVHDATNKANASGERAV